MPLNLNKDLVLIDWIDATYDQDGWQTFDEAGYELEPATMKTAGFVTESTKDYITIVQTLTSDNGFMNRFTISTGCIKKIETLKRKLKEKTKDVV